MQLSSSTSKTQFPLFSFCQNPNSKKIVSKLQIKSLQFYSSLHSSPCSTKESASPLQQNLLLDPEDDERNEEESQEKSEIGSLVVRRPTKDLSTDLNDDSLAESDKQSSIDQGLSDFAKTMPMFEPERVEGAMDKPLAVNLELALYKAKILGRNFQFEEAEKVLQKCILFWPEDGRPYVALGKILCKQSKYAEARLVYEKGCQATQGENSYIWQCWAVLENKNGNVRRARELFDAATVADKKHIAAWHGWAILEIQQGNLKKARNLLGKGLKYSGGNEYIYQTLALLEAKGNRIEQARYLFRQATSYNPKSCASWLAWAQLEMQQENYRAATELFEKAVQASPKNRFAWHVWALFEINLGKIEKGRKLLKIGHALNPRDPVILQSLALLEYKHSSANLARVLFRRASELDPRHQPVWMAWGWLEWKEGNISTARELYQRALSINSTSDSAARCLQAWGVLEQRAGNMSAARRLFRSSLNINPQSYVTWMTWATLEEQQGNSLRAEEIKNLYFQQRTEVVDDGSWVIGFLDVIDPALESLKRLLNFDQVSVPGNPSDLRNSIKPGISDSSSYMSDINKEEKLDESSFDLDSFIKDKLSLDSTKLDAQLLSFETRGNISSKRIWKSERKTAPVSLPS